MFIWHYIAGLFRSEFLPKREVFEEPTPLENAVENGKEFVEDTAEAIRKKKDEIIAAINLALPTAKEESKKVLQQLLLKFSEQWEQVEEWYREKRETITDNIRGKLDPLMNGVNGTPGDTKKTESPGETLANANEKVVEATKEAAGKAGEKTLDAAAAYDTKVTEFTTWLGDTWAGRNFREYVSDPVSERASGAWSELSQAMSDWATLPSKEVPKPKDATEVAQKTSEIMQKYATALDEKTLPSVPARPITTDTDKVKNVYFAALRERARTVEARYILMVTDFKKSGLDQMSGLSEEQKKSITGITNNALAPVKLALEADSPVKDDERITSVRDSYLSVQKALASLSGKTMSPQEIAASEKMLRSRLEDATGLRTPELEEIDQKQHPFLYILMTIAKAFGAQIHIDTKTNAIVGWSGGKNEDKNVQFARVASEYVEQHAWIKEFDTLKIQDPDLRSWLSTTLLNGACFPISNVDSIAKAKVNRRLFLREIAKAADSKEKIASVIGALEYLNKHPLEVVQTTAENPAKAGQLDINMLPSYITNPSSSNFYPAKK